MLRVTPIYGSYGHHPSSLSLALPPSSTLIEYGGVKVLVNVGWNESFLLPPHCAVLRDRHSLFRKRLDDKESYHYPPNLPDVDAIILTDSSLQSLGGLPIYFPSSSVTNTTDDEFRSNIRVGIYATFPTKKMGQMTLYDHHSNISLDGGKVGYTLEDVDSLFSNISSSFTSKSFVHENETNSEHEHNNRGYRTVSTLNYAQTLILNNPITGKPALEITPHRAGHLAGASYYILRRLTDETEVVVAPVFHHAKEKHLDSSTLYKFGTAADVLITCPGGPGGLLGKLYSSYFLPRHNFSNDCVVGLSNSIAGNENSRAVLNPPIVGRDEGELVETILSTLRRGGNVLLPVDASGRVLEILLLLNEHWERHRLKSAYSLAWIGPMTPNILEFARSQLEWMAEPLGAQFDGGKGHPFHFSSVQVCCSVREWENLRIKEGTVENPAVTLASGASLDNGPARDLFLKWFENSDNTIIITDSRHCVLRGNIFENKRKIKGNKNNKENHHLKKFSSISMEMMTGKIINNVVNNNDLKGHILNSFENQGEISSNQVTHEAINKEDRVFPASCISSEEGNNVDLDSTVITCQQIGSSSTSSMDISEHSTASQLLIKWCEAKAAREEMDDIIAVDVYVPKRVPLSGHELAEYLADEESTRLQAEAEEECRAILREVELAKGRLRLNSEDGEMETINAVNSIGENYPRDVQNNPVENSAVGKSAFVLSNTISKDGSKLLHNSLKRPRKINRFDANLFLKFSKPCHMTFEVREEAVGLGQSDSVAKYGIGESLGRVGEILEDDYGIAVRHERFIDIVTGVESCKHALGNSGISDDQQRNGDRDLSGEIEIRKVSQNKELLQNIEDNIECADLSEGKGIIRGINGRPPIKILTVSKHVEVLAEIAFIPLEGRVDAKAARQSIRALQPRQVVILGGGKPPHVDLNQVRKSIGINDEAVLMMDSIRSLFLGKKSIFVPSDGEAIELSVGHAAYSVRLVDTPYMDIQENVQVTGSYEAKLGECSVSLLNCVATGQKVATDGSIVLAPSRLSDYTKQPNVMLSNGEVLLTDLRSELIAQGMKAEYSAHAGYSQLILSGKIIIKKNQSTGKINIEGPLCEEFFIVRSIVCDQYITL